MKSSDITTIYHETAHYFERTLTPEEKAHFDAIYGEYAEGRARSEAFAEGFVRWAADGWYGTKEQHGLFAKFARFIRETFRQIPDGAEANFKVTPQMQLFYRAMLGDEKAKAALGKAIEKRDASGTPSKIKPATPNVLYQTSRAEDIVQRLKNEVDREKLTNEESGILDVYIGNKSETDIRANDLGDLLSFVKGSRYSGARKIIVKHGGENTTGGLSPAEMVKIGEVIRNGRIDNASFSETKESIRYRYDLAKDGIKFGAVVEEFNNGRKVIDYYSDRNFVDYEAEPKAHPRRPADDILLQTGQEVKPEDTLFIRPSDDMKGFWQKWVDNVYKGATAIVDSKKYDDVKWVRRIRENLLLHANRGELYLDHLTEFRMRLTSGYDRAVDLGKALAKELTPIEREILTRKLA